MCGDHVDICKRNNIDEGSPPHVRGPLAGIVALVMKIGITPACAGTTKEVEKVWILHGDHPRMCGDHYHADN